MAALSLLHRMLSSALAKLTRDTPAHTRLTKQLRRLVNLCVRHAAFSLALSVALQDLGDWALGMEVAVHAMPTDPDFARLAAAEAKLCQAAVVERIRARESQSDGGAGAGGGAGGGGGGGGGGEVDGAASTAPADEAAVTAALEEEELVAAAVSWHRPAMEALQAAQVPHGGTATLLRASADSEVVARMVSAMMVCNGNLPDASVALKAAGLTREGGELEAIANAAADVRAPLQQKPSDTQSR